MWCRRRLWPGVEQQIDGRSVLPWNSLAESYAQNNALTAASTGVAADHRSKVSRMRVIAFMFSTLSAKRFFGVADASFFDVVKVPWSVKVYSCLVSPVSCR